MINKHRILEERGFKCEMCGSKVTNDYQIHHCLFHRMKGRPELDEDYNLMIVCQKCHPKCNAHKIRCAFWWKQTLRFGPIALVNWYNRVRVSDKPHFWKGLKGYSLQGDKNNNFIVVWDSGEKPLIGDIMDRPLNPEQVIKSLYKISIQPSEEVPPGIKGAMIGIMEGLLGSKVRRQILLHRIFPGKWPSHKKVSTNDLLPGQLYALKRWIEPTREEPPGKGWYGSIDFITEATIVMAESKMKEGQEHLDPEKNTFFLEFCQGRYGAVPVMACGDQADDLTGLFEPYCSKCAKGGENELAYQMMADMSLKELEEGVNAE